MQTESTKVKRALFCLWFQRLHLFFLFSHTILQSKCIFPTFSLLTRYRTHRAIFRHLGNVDFYPLSGDYSAQYFANQNEELCIPPHTWHGRPEMFEDLIIKVIISILIWCSHFLNCRSHLSSVLFRIYSRWLFTLPPRDILHFPSLSRNLQNFKPVQILAFTWNP